MLSEHFARKNSLFFLLQWLLLAAVIAGVVGSASALFLFSLDWATASRLQHHWLIWLLPFAGFAVGWVYLRFGRSVEAGNNLILEQVHSPAKVIGLRMAPLVFIGTVISHLFGASVGREGTAVQMGASIADQFTSLLKLDDDARRMVLMAGVSAGFSSVFGTPFAGAIFGLEVMAIGRMHYTAIFPCLPFAFLAGIGFVAVFAGAANTPIASTLMAIELFGADIGIYAAMGCVVAYLVSGYTGIYRSQRVACLKHRRVPKGIKLTEIPTWQREQA